MSTGTEDRGTHFGKLLDKDGQELTSNPKQAAITPLKKDADNTAIVNKVNEIVAALKLSNIVENKAEK